MGKRKQPKQQQQQATDTALHVPAQPLAEDSHLLVRIELGRVREDVTELHVLEDVPVPIAGRFARNAVSAGWVASTKL